MQEHTRIYLAAMNYSVADFIPCEVCGARSGPPHHIHRRGMGGSKHANYPENLMGLCMTLFTHEGCHQKYGDIEELKLWLYELHIKRLFARNPQFQYSQEFRATHFFSQLLQSGRIPPQQV